MFCNQCGTEIPENAKFCNKCGCAVNAEGEEKKIIHTAENTKAEPNKTETAKEPPYMKYCDKMKKINKLTLIAQFLSVILGLSILFLPIYQYKYEPSLEDIESWEQLGTVLENDGYIIKNFSLADDVGKMINSYAENNGNVETMRGFPLCILLISIVVGLIVALIVILKDMCRNLFSAYNGDIVRSAMLKYDEIKFEMNLSAKEKKYSESRKRALNNNIMPIFIICCLDVFFCQIFNSSGTAVTKIQFRYMQDFSGVSGFIFLLLIMAVCFIIVDSMRKKEEKEMLASITEEKYQSEQ